MRSGDGGGTRAAEACPDLILDGDLVLYKTAFSAALSSDLIDQLRARDIDTSAFITKVRAIQPAAR